MIKGLTPMLYQIRAHDFTARFETNSGVVTLAAPRIARHVAGKKTEEILTLCRNMRWELLVLDAIGWRMIRGSSTFEQEQPGDYKE